MDAYVVPRVGGDPALEFEIRWYMRDQPLPEHDYPGSMSTDDQFAMFVYLMDGGHTEESATACLASYRAIPLPRNLLPRTFFLRLDVTESSIATWTRIATREARQKQQRFVITFLVMRIMMNLLQEQVNHRVQELLTALGGVTVPDLYVFWRPGFYAAHAEEGQEQRRGPVIMTRVLGGT